MLKQALELLGFRAPFVYAAATYGAFYYLDRKASGPAKRAISAWINSIYISRQLSSGGALELFDRIYTVPLWGWRAIVRSILYTTIVTILAIWEIYPALFWLVTSVPVSFTIQWSQRIMCNYLADYAALYLIR